MNGAQTPSSAPENAPSQDQRRDQEKAERESVTAASFANRLVLHASLALLVFSVITTVALVAWFAHVDDPLQWQAVIAVLSAALGLTAAALVWRAPSRLHVRGALGVLAFSILRIGPPSDWTLTTLVLIVVTAILAAPLVRLLRTLPNLTPP